MWLGLSYIIIIYEKDDRIKWAIAKYVHITNANRVFNENVMNDGSKAEYFYYVYYHTFAHFFSLVTLYTLTHSFYIYMFNLPKPGRTTSVFRSTLGFILRCSFLLFSISFFSSFNFDYIGFCNRLNRML